MAGETSYDKRLQDLEAAAFRTGRTLAEHSAQLQQIGAASEDRTIAQRLDRIERVLFALARAQGIDPDQPA